MRSPSFPKPGCGPGACVSARRSQTPAEPVAARPIPSLVKRCCTRWGGGRILCPYTTQTRGLSPRGWQHALSIQAISGVRACSQGARLPQLPPTCFYRRPGHGPSRVPAVQSLRPTACDPRAANRFAALADARHPPIAEMSRPGHRYRELTGGPHRSARTTEPFLSCGAASSVPRKAQPER